MGYNDIEKLVGKKILKIEMAGNEHINFKTEAENLCFYAYGDCCSSSWIEHLNGVQNLIGHTVQSILESDTVVEKNHPEHDCLQIYRHTLKTEAGDCDIEYRNSSNGYYGGSLESCEFDPKNSFKEVTEDF